MMLSKMINKDFANICLSLAHWSVWKSRTDFGNSLINIYVIPRWKQHTSSTLQRYHLLGPQFNYSQLGNAFESGVSAAGVRTYDIIRRYARLKPNVLFLEEERAWGSRLSEIGDSSPRAARFPSISPPLLASTFICYTTVWVVILWAMPFAKRKKSVV